MDAALLPDGAAGRSAAQVLRRPPGGPARDLAARRPADGRVPGPIVAPRRGVPAADRIRGRALCDRPAGRSRATDNPADGTVPLPPPAARRLQPGRGRRLGTAA